MTVMCSSGHGLGGGTGRRSGRVWHPVTRTRPPGTQVFSLTVNFAVLSCWFPSVST